MSHTSEAMSRHNQAIDTEPPIHRFNVNGRARRPGHRPCSVTEPVISRNAYAMANLPKRRILNSRLAEIGHSRSSKPEFALEGIGPAEFRSHYLRLESGVVLDLFTAELTVASGDAIVCAGETAGIPVEELVGRSVTGVWNDDTFSCIVILDNDIYLKDANDGV